MKPTLTIVFFALVVQIQAQTIDHQVFGSSGSVFSNTAAITNFTIGEIFVGPISNTKSINQGFWAGIGEAAGNASGEVVTSLNDFEKEKFGLAIYPNPAITSITVIMRNNLAYEISLFNVNGQQVLYEKINTYQESNNIDINGLSPGIYLVKLFIPATKIYKTVKISKL